VLLEQIEQLILDEVEVDEQTQVHLMDELVVVEQ
jgi:hypothetical protein